MPNKKPAIEVIGHDACSGCGACSDACPSSAINIQQDHYGFLRPGITDSKCNRCGACALHCPIAKVVPNVDALRQPLLWGGWSANENVRLSSTSGGIAYELAASVVDQGGVVVGCVLEHGGEVRHRLIERREDLALLQRSKYAPSRLDGIYAKALVEVNKGRRVAFFGLPCQAAAFQRYLKPTQLGKVIAIEVICFGVPSLLAWQRHVDGFTPKKIVDVDFRDKKPDGWSMARISYRFDDGGAIRRKPSWDAYLSGFHKGVFHQSICHACPFAEWPRHADLTLGDFWGITPERKDERGVSLIVATTERGRDAMTALVAQRRIEVFQTSLAEASRENPRLVSVLPISHPHLLRQEALRRLAAGESLQSISRLYMPSLATRILRKLVPHVLRSRITTLLKFRGQQHLL